MYHVGRRGHRDSSLRNKTKMSQAHTLTQGKAYCNLPIITGCTRSFYPLQRPIATGISCSQSKHPAHTKNLAAHTLLESHTRAGKHNQPEPAAHPRGPQSNIQLTPRPPQHACRSSHVRPTGIASPRLTLPEPQSNIQLTPRPPSLTGWGHTQG